MTKVRVYMGEVIFPKNVHGFYSSRVECQPLAADTLEGMRSLIRQAKRSD